MKKRKMKRILLLVILVLAFSAALLSMHSNGDKNTVMIVIPNDFEGRVLITFNKEDTKPLLYGKYGYYASFENSSTIETSTTLKEFKNIKFFLVHLNNKNQQELQNNESIFLNYSDWYSGQHNESSNGRFKSKEIYVGYFYKSDSHKSSKDSLFKFLKEINGDTLLFSPSVIKNNY